MSDEFTQMWTTVFRARALLNDAGLGVKWDPDDLLPVIEDLLALLGQLRSSYDAQYARLWQARDLLGEMTHTAPVDDPGHSGEGEAWHAVSHDLLLRAEKFLRSTGPPIG
jgi:hypothetical protein